MRIDILTLFPEAFQSVLDSSILRRAQEKKKVQIRVHDIREHALDRYRTCDDRPFGGGPGMVLKPEPIDRLCRKLLRGKRRSQYRFIYMSAQGKPFKQKRAAQLAKQKHLVVLCGHYEGVDERVLKIWAHEEISMGDYILTGGELPAMVLADAVVRLLPGVLGNEDSKNFESFSENLLEYPHYTRPQDFRGLSVPRELLTGNHKVIEAWRRQMAHRRTRLRRPEILKKG